MNKCAFLVLLLIPTISLGAPSVKMLGGTPSVSTAVNTGSKVIPVKASVSKETPTQVSRLGSVRSVPKTSTTSSYDLNSDSSRLPFMPSRSYNSVKVPQKEVSQSNVSLDIILDALKNYYTKEEVYNNDEFQTAVFDTIKLKVGKPVGNFDEEYMYIWIEEE